MKLTKAKAKQMSLDKWEEIIETGLHEGNCGACGYCNKYWSCGLCTMLEVWGMTCLDSLSPYDMYCLCKKRHEEKNAQYWAMVIYMDILDT